MSRLRKRKDRKGWFVDYWDERGNRIRRKLEGVVRKRDAEAQLAELVGQVNRRRLGLEPAAVSLRSTVWELVEWWLTNRCPKPSLNNERRRLTKHLRDTELGRLSVAHARPAHFEAWFAELERARPRALAPASINHLRSKVRTAFERARREDVFTGRNPLQETKKRRVPKRVYETLSAEEAVQVLAKVPTQWRGFVAAGVYLALRKGEIAGLPKRAVDLGRMLITVGTSYERDTTKGGHGDLLPIPEVMRPYLEAALKTPGLLLFADARGRMRKPYSKPDVTLRRAVANAGLTMPSLCIGYRLICRRCTPDKKLKAEVLPARPVPPPRCPVCTTRRLWVTPLPRHLRFHDLRHSTATILLRAGMPLQHVQKIMRHANIETTVGIYGHLVVEDLRAGLHAAFGAGAELDLEKAERTELVAEIMRLRRLLPGGGAVADAEAGRHLAATAQETA